MEASPLYIQLSCQEGASDNYCSAVRSQGGVPRAAYAPEPDLTCAGLILCGGGDLDPALFFQENRGAQPPDPVRDRAELALFLAFLQAGKPILGICRGLQVINVALGGTLIQDLPEPVRPFHTGGRPDRLHPLRSAPGSLCEQLYGPLFLANSAHHQAVDRPGVGLKPTAWSESGLVEAAEHETLPVLGVQFHPERLTADRWGPAAADGSLLFRYFLSLCRGAA